MPPHRHCTPWLLAAVLTIFPTCARAAPKVDDVQPLSEHFGVATKHLSLLMATQYHIWRITPGVPRRHLAVASSIRKPVVSDDGRRCLVMGNLDADLVPGGRKGKDESGIWLLDADGSITRLRKDEDVQIPLTSFLQNQNDRGVMVYVPDSRFDPRGWIRAATTEGLDTILVLLGATEAHRVALLGSGPDIEALHSAGASLDERRRFGWTPLELAIVSGNEIVAAKLCSLGVESARGFSRALAMSVCLGRLATLRTLVQFGAEVRGRDSLGAGLLHYAVQNPEGLREPFGTDLRHRLLGFRAHRSPITSDTFGACVATLIDLGADVRAVDDLGRTPLHRLVGDEYVDDAWKRRQCAAAGKLCADVAKRLLAAGADPNARDSDGRTPLHVAIQRQRFDLAEPVLRVLIAHGALVDATPMGTASGLTALQEILGEKPTADDLRAAAFLAANGAPLDGLPENQRLKLESRLRRGSPAAWAP